MLTIQRRLSQRTVAVLLTLVMLNVYVLMGARTSQASTNTPEVSSSSKLLVGRLALADQQSIFVNGNEARTGTSIFSGMRLQSPDGVNAVVQLGALGHINLESSTDLTLDFSNARVAVTVASGNATLTTKEGVEATLTAPDGNIMKSVGTRGSVLSTNSAAAAAMSGKKKAAIIIPIVAAIVIIAIVVADDDDESPSNP